jgi:flavin reductase (DIM6/NTAB) family NADH-FMN oxidoreductase RutF
VIDPPPDGIEQRPVAAARRLLLGGPVALLTSRDRGNVNVMPVAWHMPVSSDPMLIAVAIEQSRHTLDLVRSSEEFALNFPTRRLLHHVQYLGSLRGEDIDKFEATQLETFDASHVSAPLMRDCVAWIECEVQEILPFGDHHLCIALVVRVDVLPESFDDDRWQLEPEEQRPLHYLGGTLYAQLERVLEARVPRDLEAPEDVLADRIAEELDLTEEARERRAERLGELQREVDAGNVIDLSELAAAPLPEIDLTRGVVIGTPPQLED